MQLTLVWAIVAIIAIITLLAFCYSVWQQTRLPTSSKRSRKGRLANEPIQNRPSHKGSSAGQGTTSNAFQRTPPVAKPPQTHPSLKVNSGDEPTVARSSQEVDPGDDRTVARRPQKNSQASDRTHIGRSQKDDAASDRTEIGRKRSKKVNPDDDRTLF